MQAAFSFRAIPGGGEQKGDEHLVLKGRGLLHATKRLPGETSALHSNYTTTHVYIHFMFTYGDFVYLITSSEQNSLCILRLAEGKQLINHSFILGFLSRRFHCRDSLKE